jgi:hypothetical protein
VEALYPNIDQDGLQGIFDNKYPENSQLVCFVLGTSVIEYNDNYYQQRNGIAMGTNAAVSLANIYLGEYLDPIYRNCKFVQYYRRYIDDLFIVWKGSRQDWTDFQNFVQDHLDNQFDQKLRINFEQPSTTATFLDINIKINRANSKFETSIYQKELNKYMYLTPKSCHVPHVFSGFIKGELTRYSRLSTNPFNYLMIKKLFYQRLVERGYSRLFLNTIFKKHKWSSRFVERSNPPTVLMPLVLPYSKRKNLVQVEKFIKSSQEKFQAYLDFAKPLVVYKKTPNINQLISSSSLTKGQSEKIKEMKRFKDEQGVWRFQTVSN